MVGCLTMTFALAAMGGPASVHDVKTAVPVRGAGARAAAAELLTIESRRIRAMDPQVARLLAEGVRRSKTFAELVSTLHTSASDVIVYVERTDALPARMAGRLLLQAVTPHERYLRVQIKRNLRPHEAIEVIAHELQHALEVAADPSVADDAGLERLYRRIGYTTFEERGFDTLAARRAGERVRAELRS